MPTKKKAAEPDANQSSTAGYVRRPRYRDIEFAPEGLEDGETPFRVKIQRNLTFDQINEIPIGENVTFPEIWEVIYPYVVEWNAMARDEATGEMALAPPPAEAGPEIAKILDAEESLWLIVQVKQAHLGGVERKNSSAPSGDTPGQNGARN